MRRLRFIFNIILGRFGRGRRSRPENIPKKLDAGTLEKALQEARFLHSQHAVDVKPLATGEIPMPCRADDKD